MSSFKGQDIFGSGPHRFSAAPRGQLLISALSQNQFDPSSIPLGLLEEEVRVRGRLVGTSQAQLRQRIDAVNALLEHPPTPGVLIDEHGKQYAGMSFVRFEEEDRTDRGRVCSLAYEAVFRRLIVLQ
jgi:hypothetical protein